MNSAIYETKMPSYLAMSRGDLIAEVLSVGEVVKGHLETSIPQDSPPKAIDAAAETVRIANDVLRERFGIEIHFHYNGDEPDFGLLG